MPFNYDLSQIFQSIMQQTMWDFKFNSWDRMGSGFCGNFMNSCFGGGFQMPGVAWGDNFVGAGGSSSGGSSKLTPEERAQKRINENKFKTLKNLVNEWVKDFKDSSDLQKATLYETYKAIGNYSEENYEKLKDFYNENKAEIQNKVKTDIKITPSADSNLAATEFAKSDHLEFNKILETDSDGKTTENLKTKVDAMEFLNALQKSKGKSFKELYNEAITQNPTQIDEYKKVMRALSAGLVVKAAEALDLSGLSDETKNALTGLKEIAPAIVTPDQIDQLYYWIRIATAENADNKYACLKDDFPGDALIGNTDNVASVKNEMKTVENLDTDTIQSQPVNLDYNSYTAAQSMASLSAKGAVRELTSAQLEELKKIAGFDNLFPDGLTTAWVDVNTNELGSPKIRYADGDQIKSITGVTVNDEGNVELAPGATLGIDSTPVNVQSMENRAQTVKAVDACVNEGLLEEITDRTGLPDEYENYRIFQETELRNGETYRKVYFVDDDGDLKEITNIQYIPPFMGICFGFNKIHSGMNITKGAPVAVEAVRNVMSRLTELNNMTKIDALLDGRTFPNPDSVTVDSQYFDMKNIYVSGNGVSGYLTNNSLSELYNKDCVITIKRYKDTRNCEWAKKENEVKPLFESITKALIKSLKEKGLDENMLERARQAVYDRYVGAQNEIKNNDSEREDPQKCIDFVRDEYKDEQYRHKILDILDDNGKNSHIYTVRFKDLVDDILEEYKKLA